VYTAQSKGVSISGIIQFKYIRDLLGHRYFYLAINTQKYIEIFSRIFFTGRYSLLYSRLMDQTHYEDQRYQQV